MYGPTSRSKRSTMLGAIGAPPLYALVSDDRSAPATAGSFASAVNAVMAITVNVQRCSSASRMIVAGWKPVAEHDRHGHEHPDGDVRDRPVMWNSGAPPSTTSRGVRVIQSRNVQALNTTLPWVFIAPLGSPVVPEV